MDERTDAEKAERRAQYITHFWRDVPEEFDRADDQDFRREGATCCIRGRATREVPCQNPSFRVTRSARMKTKTAADVADACANISAKAAPAAGMTRAGDGSPKGGDVLRLRSRQPGGASGRAL